MYSFNSPLTLGTNLSSFKGTHDEFSNGSIFTAFDVRTSRKTSGGITGLTLTFLQPACVYWVRANVYMYLEVFDEIKNFAVFLFLQHFILTVGARRRKIRLPV